VLLLSSLGPVRAQDSGLGEVVRVRVVEVDVQVTNKKGQPITGLTADDFVLFEDGQPVPIEYFSVTGEPDTRSPAAGEVPGE